MAKLTYFSTIASCVLLLTSCSSSTSNNNSQTQKLSIAKPNVQKISEAERQRRQEIVNNLILEYSCPPSDIYSEVLSFLNAYSNASQHEYLYIKEAQYIALQERVRNFISQDYLGSNYLESNIYVFPESYSPSREYKLSCIETNGDYIEATLTSYSKKAIGYFVANRYRLIRNGSKFLRLYPETPPEHFSKNDYDFQVYTEELSRSYLTPSRFVEVNTRVYTQDMSWDPNCIYCDDPK
jgi:hypothetical protein